MKMKQKCRERLIKEKLYLRNKWLMYGVLLIFNGHFGVIWCTYVASKIRFSKHYF